MRRNTVDTETDETTKNQLSPLYHVIILNDDDHTFGGLPSNPSTAVAALRDFGGIVGSDSKRFVSRQTWAEHTSQCRHASR